MGRKAATFDNPIAELRARAAMAQSVEDIHALYNPGDTLKLRIILENLTPDRFPDEVLAKFVEGADFRTSSVLFRNPGLSAEQVRMLVRAIVTHRAYTGDFLRSWVNHLWVFQSPYGDLIRQTIRSIALGKVEVVRDAALTIADTILEIDDGLSAQEIRTLVDLYQPIFSVLASAARHPAADSCVWDALLQLIEKGVMQGNLIRLMLGTRACDYPRFRAVVMKFGADDILRRIAPSVTADEVLPLFRRAREIRADERRLLDLVPAEHITPEVKAFLLQHPDPDFRIEQILDTSHGRPARAR